MTRCLKLIFYTRAVRRLRVALYVCERCIEDLFITGQYGPQPYPIKQLVAYERLFNVTGGSSQTASLNITLGSLARRDEQGNAVLYPGDYALLVDVPTQATYNFTLTGSQTTIDHWPQPR